MNDVMTLRAPTDKGTPMLREILNKFLNLQDVRGVIVLRGDGGIIETLKSGMEYDTSFMAAVSNFMVGSKATLETFGNTPAFMAFIEFSEYFLLLVPLSEDFFLLVIAQNTANIAQINQEIKKNKETLLSLL
jgi:predicted regulator of Ras-like GTPase activity (Roadblock/LC7/MglB family)